MSPEMIVRIMREGLLMVLLLSGGPMLASMLVGLVVSLLQATTQIQEQTLSYVPKLGTAIYATLAAVFSRPQISYPPPAAPPAFALTRVIAPTPEFSHSFREERERPA